MAQQVETLFFVDPPEGRSCWGGVDARLHLSHLAGDVLPLALFHKNEDGTRDQSRALVRWGGGRNCFRVTGIGYHAVQAVQTAGLQVARALSSDAKRPVRVELRESVVSLVLQRAPLLFRVHHLVVAKSTAETGAFWNGLDDAGRRERIAQLVLRGLAAQIRALQRTGEDDGLPDPDSFFEGMVGIRVVEIGDPMVSRVSVGEKPRHVDVVGVTFEACMKLGGHWNAGFMGHLGFGRIEPVDARGTAGVFRSEAAADDPEHPRIRRASFAKGGAR